MHAQVESLKRLLKRADEDRAGLTAECRGLTERLGAAAKKREACECECKVSVQPLSTLNSSLNRACASFQPQRQALCGGVDRAVDGRASWTG